MAVTDAAFNSDTASAGPVNGVIANAIGVVNSFVPSDRANLNTDGISVLRDINGQTMLYGYQTLSTSPIFQDAGPARLRMQLVYNCQQILQTFLFADIDGRGHLFAAIAGALTDYLNSLWKQGALYGATPSQAFSVNTGPAVNTPITIAARQVNAAVSARLSPTAEMITLNITAYAVNQSIAA